MSTRAVVETLAASAILVGLVGVVVPLLPGSLLVGGAVLVWALYVGTSAAWVTFAVVVTLLVVGQVAMYLVPGRRLRAAGVPGRTLLAGTALGVVGFFAALVGFFLVFLRVIAKSSWIQALLLTAGAAGLMLGLANVLNLVFPGGLLQEYYDLPWPFR